ncbi:hypothetical protein CGLO_02340 [Colletotrichum gloeosporioides Cg-14]|uniref:ToxB-like N-terminal ascomycota domain-containing protein n=1 Tax=Colletotrichum gloeosporioides (strain Cg-14) TaxID=1237896 RepID=T0M181_COLGC|nr:hypothetical protein CGLO_02340 [Colletotrichum gloeosporioides Cg-14]
MKFTVAVCLLASYTGLAAAAGCQVELLNINQAVVGSGCVQMNYYANIYDSITRAGYTVNANNNCGLSFSGSQRIPDGYSLRRAISSLALIRFFEIFDSVMIFIVLIIAISLNTLFSRFVFIRTALLKEA